MNFPDIVFITGTSAGFGRQLAAELLKSNPQSMIVGVSRTPTEIIAKNFNWCRLDISNLGDTEHELSNYISKFTYPELKIGVVLSAATLGTSGGLLDSDLEEWDGIYRTNVLGNLAVLQGLLPRMVQVRYGRIIFLSGGGAAYGYPLFSGYALSKAAIVREVENLSLELADKGDFSTVALAPGAMATEMLEKVRAVGGEVKTTVDIQEPIEFCKEFLQSENAFRLDGKFVHVRDNWKKYLDDNIPVEKNKWLLRRTE